MLHDMNTFDKDDVVVPVCVNCGMEGAKNICNKCKQVSYCNAACKKKHRHKHKKDCEVSVCANCGKEGNSNNMNTCNKCIMVKYCNAVCKKIHKKKHKKDCEEHVRRVAEKHNEELRIAAELHDEKLFKQPPPKEDCPICFLRLPTLNTGWNYKTCCGKAVCSGCFRAPLYDNQGNKVNNKKCPYCRAPTPESNEEIVERLQKRVEVGDPIAIYNLGIKYRDAEDGYPQDHVKALELHHRAGELGNAMAYGSIGWAYDHGEGVEVDKKKAIHCYELAAMKGDAISRYILGVNEENADNMNRALKHYMIAVTDGHAESLQEIQDLFTNGHATKEDYTKALRSYQEYLCEVKSRQRDEAAAADEENRYY